MSTAPQFEFSFSFLLLEQGYGSGLSVTGDIPAPRAHCIMVPLIGRPTQALIIGGSDCVNDFDDLYLLTIGMTTSTPNPLSHLVSFFSSFLSVYLGWALYQWMRGSMRLCVQRWSSRDASSRVCRGTWRSPSVRDLCSSSADSCKIPIAQCPCRDSYWISVCTCRKKKKQPLFVRKSHVCPSGFDSDWRLCVKGVLGTRTYVSGGNDGMLSRRSPCTDLGWRSRLQSTRRGTVPCSRHRSVSARHSFCLSFLSIHFCLP